MGRLLNDSEKSLFDGINAEFVELVGNLRTVYYHRISGEETRDPVYDEPAGEVFRRFELPIFITWPENMLDLSLEAGRAETFTAQATVSRKLLDDLGAPYPDIGDIIEAWRTSSLDASTGGGMIFDVKLVAVDGVLDDSSYFTQFQLTLERNTEYGPERRIQLAEVRS